MPDVTNRRHPIALGMRAPGWSVIAVWRLDGEDAVEIPVHGPNARIVYPDNLGIELLGRDEKLIVRFPRDRMASIISVLD